MVPPPIEGTATPDLPANDDLIYQLSGDIYTAPPAPQSPPFDVTTSLTYMFRKSSEEEPDSEADDLPVDTDEDDIEA